MKKRLAKKIVSVRYSNRLWIRYRTGVGPWPESIPRVVEARRVLRRRLSAYRHTMKLVRAMSRGLPAAEVIRRWSDLRSYIVRGFRHADAWTHAAEANVDFVDLHLYKPGPGDDDSPVGTFQAQIRGWLDYFADRWHVSRVQRMDHMMTRLQEIA